MSWGCVRDDRAVDRDRIREESLGAGQLEKVLEPTGQVRDLALDVCLDIGQKTRRNDVSTGWAARCTPLLDCVAASLACTLAVERDALVPESIARFDWVGG
jgi:hypothetical protein